MDTLAQMTIQIDRDSVHPGDDLVSHATTLNISHSATIADFLKEIRQVHFLPSISGGKATWLIDSEGSESKCIGVLAQQWSEPKLTISASTPITEISSGKPGFYFRYWCQADPDTVFSCVRSGRELPDKYR